MIMRHPPCSRPRPRAPLTHVSFYDHDEFVMFIVGGEVVGASVNKKVSAQYDDALT